MRGIIIGIGKVDRGLGMGLIAGGHDVTVGGRRRPQMKAWEASRRRAREVRLRLEDSR
jgi:predicted dinucleotide-binding enzyme